MKFNAFVKEVRDVMRARKAPMWHTFKGEDWEIGRGHLFLFTVGDFDKGLAPTQIDLLAAKVAMDTIKNRPVGQVVLYPPVLQIYKENETYIFEVGNLKHKVYLDKEYVTNTRNMLWGAFLKLGIPLDLVEVRSALRVIG
jgi:hypothetical protein